MLGDLAVNRMGFGAMRLAGAQSGVPGDRAQAIWVLRRAVGLGVNHIDTAAFYFSPSRSANELINSALAPYPDDLVITTKVWPGRDPSGEWYWAEPSQLRGQVEENLRQLGQITSTWSTCASRAAPKARRSLNISPRSLRCVPPG